MSQTGQPKETLDFMALSYCRGFLVVRFRAVKRLQDSHASRNRIPRVSASLIAQSSCALIFTLVVLAVSLQAQTESVLYSFKGGSDGENPYAGLVRGAHGELYGTALQGGGAIECAPGCGAIFTVTATGLEKVINIFTLQDGAYPFDSLIQDAKGNFYGTTFQGGSSVFTGTVFKITASGKETILHSFTGSPDGAYPYASLVRDAEGDLYGTTSGGGTYGAGAVFEITSSGQESLLYSFTGGADGGVPYSGLVLDASGRLYGTTSVGGSSLNCTGGCGTVFEITSSGEEKVIYSFSGADGQVPYAGLIVGANGNFYGTTTGGGVAGFGTVFEVTSAGKEKVLYSFTNATDGGTPWGVVVQDAKGNLYGTTSTGASQNCAGGCGTVFELTASGKFEVLHAFTGGTDGGVPNAGLILDGQGNLYSTTTVGGANGLGTVFRIVP